MEDLVNDLMVSTMMIRRTRMRLEVAIKIRRETIPIISVIRTIEIRQEEAEDKDIEEEASSRNVFIVEKKGIEHLSVFNAKEGQMQEQKARTELHILMKMPDSHNLKMLKEEKSQLTKESN